MARRPARRLARPLLPASPPPAASGVTQPPRPAPAPRPERVGIVVWIYRDGFVRVFAPSREAVQVHVAHLLDVPGSRCEAMAEELAYLDMPAWARRVLDTGREVATGGAAWCRTLDQYCLIQLDRDVHDCLNRLDRAWHGGVQ